MKPVKTRDTDPSDEAEREWYWWNVTLAHRFGRKAPWQ